jgi:hypothetical protein
MQKFLSAVKIPKLLVLVETDRQPWRGKFIDKFPFTVDSPKNLANWIHPRPKLSLS